MVNDEKQKEDYILSLCDAHDDSTDITKQPKCSNHINKRQHPQQQRKRLRSKAGTNSNLSGMEIFQKRQIHYRPS